jgi:hypothetical protein
VPSTAPEGKKRTVTKKKATTTKANTSKPRTKVTGGRVTKKTPAKSTVTKAKKSPVAKAKDKVTGAAEKVAGAIEGKPGKKGMFSDEETWYTHWYMRQHYKCSLVIMGITISISSPSLPCKSLLTRSCTASGEAKIKGTKKPVAKTTKTKAVPAAKKA